MVDADLSDEVIAQAMESVPYQWLTEQTSDGEDAS